MLENVEKIKCAADKNGLKNVTCKQGLNVLLKGVEDQYFSLVHASCTCFRQMSRMDSMAKNDGIHA